MVQQGHQAAGRISPSDDQFEAHCKNNFDENGLFYCPDIAQLPKEQKEALELRGIKSVLQCAIRDGGECKGFVGFDECVIRRMWTKDQIYALTLTAMFLSVFLLKKRAQDRAEKTAAGLQMALDNQNSWIYIIDPDDFHLIYINEKTNRMAPDVKTGMYCYEVFFARTRPCEECPAKNISRNINRTMEIFNPVLNVWTEADASLIRWGEKDACMLSCHDITKYKYHRKDDGKWL